MANYHRASRQSFMPPAVVQQAQMQHPQIQAAQAQLQQAHAQMQHAVQQAHAQVQHTQGQQGTMGSYQSNMAYDAPPQWGQLSTNNFFVPSIDVGSGTFDGWVGPLSPIHMPLSAGGASNPAGVFHMPTHRSPTPAPEHRKEDQPGMLASTSSDSSGLTTVDPKVLSPPEKQAVSSESLERSPSDPKEASRVCRRQDKTGPENEEDMPDADNLSTATTAVCSCGQAMNYTAGSGVFAGMSELNPKLNGIESILLELRDYNERNRDTVPLMTAMNRSLNAFVKDQSEFRARLAVVEDRSLDSMQELVRIDASYETLSNDYVRFRDAVVEGRDAKLRDAKLARKG